MSGGLPDTGPSALTGHAAQAVERLTAAEASRSPCAPVRDLLGTDDIAGAYAVQKALIQARLATGRSVVGRKIGLTNPKVQAQLGVDQPDFGFLLDDMRCHEQDPIDHTRLLQPKVEAELAFVLKADLDHDGPITDGQVREAIDYAVPALEIVDSRVAGWDISIVDTVADNASSGLFVLGESRVPLDELDPVAVSMTLRRNGEQVSAGSGADCLGDPVTAVAWLATTARDYGDPLRAGEVILSGALGPMVPIEAGDEFVAELTGLGSVRAVFTGPAEGAS
ncbi:MAG: 2-hydroxypenta-2,4-dienoate hydratase [Actinoallomurus sp.]|nr:2-hydroxypenta-2,4-dienoate hydratase [Actinoallomurus sp.]